MFSVRGKRGTGGGRDEEEQRGEEEQEGGGPAVEGKNGDHRLIVGRGHGCTRRRKSRGTKGVVEQGRNIPDAAVHGDQDRRAAQTNQLHQAGTNPCATCAHAIVHA